jgi:hypothetical protein
MPSSQTKMDDVPPCLAYVCMAFFSDFTDGVLHNPIRVILKTENEQDNGHCLLQAFFVHWHLNGNVWWAHVNSAVRERFDC